MVKPVPTALQLPLAIQRVGLFHIDAAITSPFTAITDSGNAGVVLSDLNTAAFYSQIPGAVPNPTNVWTFPCASANHLPTLGLKFGSDTIYNLDTARLNRGPIDNSDMCAGAVYSLGYPDNIVFPGDPFMSSWYSIFDYGNIRVGFAPDAK